MLLVLACRCSSQPHLALSVGVAWPGGVPPQERPVNENDIHTSRELTSKNTVRSHTLTHLTNPDAKAFIVPEPIGLPQVGHRGAAATARAARQGQQLVPGTGQRCWCQ